MTLWVYNADLPDILASWRSTSQTPGGQSLQSIIAQTVWHTSTSLDDHHALQLVAPTFPQTSQAQARHRKTGAATTLTW